MVGRGGQVMAGRMRVAVAVAAGVAVVLAFGGAPASAAPARVGDPQVGPAGPVSGQVSAAAARQVRLITGDLVTVGADGRSSVQPRDRAGLAGQFVTVRRGGDQFVFPAAAMPYLGRGLDPALFDVTRLAAAKDAAAKDADRLPVRLAFPRGAVRPAIPGVTVTATGAGTAEGYLTAASAGAFGRALVDQARTHRGHPLFGGGATLHPAGALPVPAGKPAGSPDPTPGPPVTLRITVIGQGGKPVPQATILGLNTDDISIAAIEVDNASGPVDLSLPPGNYSFIVGALDPETRVIRLATVVDYALGTGPTSALTVDVRPAQPLSATTPRPSQLASVVANLRRNDRTGGFIGLAVTSFDVAAIEVAPAPAAAIGTLSYTADLQYVSAPGVPVPYAYNLAFGGQAGVPDSLHFTVTDADLATVNENYFVDAGFSRQPARAGMFSFLPWQDLTTTADFPFTAPGRRIDYVTGRSDAEWHASYSRDATDGAGHTVQFAESYFDSARRYDAGQQVQADWGRQPVHPGVDTQTSKSIQPFHCPACREDDTMRISGLQPLNDAANHLGGGVGFIGTTVLGPRDTTGRLQLFAGDTLLGSAFSGNEVEIPVPPVSTGYRLVLDQNRIVPWASTGVHSHTEWGFTSARPLVSTMPPDWQCGTFFEPPPNACAVLPLLVIGYAAPVDLTGVAPGGPAHLGVTAAPAQGGPVTTISSVGVDVSFDDGATFTPATVTGSGTRYDAAFTAPTSGFVTTRLRATDSAGNTVTQTVTRAYALGPAA